MADKSNRRFPSPRFTLASLLILITLCAAPFTYLSYVRRRNDQRKAAHEDLTSKGMSLRQISPQSRPPADKSLAAPADESPARQFWAEILGDPKLPKFDHVNIHDFFGKNRPRPPITDTDLAQLQFLPEIESFRFYYSKTVTDEGLAVLGKLPKLKKIQLQSLDQVTGEFLSSLPEDCPVETIWINDLKGLDGPKLTALRRLKNLKMLWISTCPSLSDESLIDVEVPPNVTDLNLNLQGVGDQTIARWLEHVKLDRLEIRCPITRALTPAIATQTNLFQLTITNAPLVDEDFTFLKQWPRLSCLKLNAMPLRGEVLDYIAAPEKLGVLELNNTLFSDKHLPKLANFPKLQLLGLAWTPLTGEGFQADVQWPTPWGIELCGTRFSDAGKDAFTNWKGLKEVCLPSNWTPEDSSRFPNGSAPATPNFNLHVAIISDGKPSRPCYIPSLKLEKIDNCPADLMKPVADLQTLGLAEAEADRKRHEASQ